MSELMDRAIIGMPYKMAMSSELSRRQFYDRAQALLAEVEGLRELLEDRARPKVIPPMTIGTKCLACGDYHHGMSGLPCPKMVATSHD